MPPIVHRASSLLGLVLLGSALAAVEVNIGATASSVTEGGSITVFATRDSNSGTLSVPVALVGSPAYASLPTSFEFANGSSIATLELTTVDDFDANGGGRQVSAQITVGGGVISTVPAVTVGVRDDDVTIALEAVDVLATEDALPVDTGQIRIKVTGARTGDLSLQFEVHGTATFATNTASDDYLLAYQVDSTVTPVLATADIEKVDVVIPDSLNEALINLTSRSDSTVEGSETCEIRLSTGSLAYTVLGSDHLPITIADDDNRITGLTGSPAYESGTNGNVRIEFLSDYPTGRTIQVPYLITGVVNDGSQFTTLSGVATLTSGHVLDIPIDAALDQVKEDDSLTLTLLPSANYILPGTPSITIPIVDCVGTASITDPADAIESEPGDPLAFEVSVARSVGFESDDVLVPFHISGGTASASEYSVAGTGVTWNAGTSSGVIALDGSVDTTTIMVTPIDDSIADGDKTVIVTLEVGQSVVVDTAHDVATGTILDDEPVVSLVRSGADTAIEGETVDFTVSYPGVPVGTPRSQPVAVRFAVSGSAAVADRTVTGTGVVMDAGGLTGTATIPAGETSLTISVTAATDALPETVETVILTLSTPPTTYRLGSETTDTVDLVDPDGRPTVNIDAVAAAIEGRTVQCFKVTRTGATTAALVVELDDPAGTATAGDYQALPASIQIPAGAAFALVPVTAISDGVDTETLELPIKADDAYLIGTGSAIVDIVSGFADNQIRITSEPADRVLAIDENWNTTCLLSIPAGVVAGRTKAELGPVPSGSAVPGWISVVRSSPDEATDAAEFVVTASPPVGTTSGVVQVRVRLMADVDANGTYELEINQDLLLWVQSAGGDG